MYIHTSTIPLTETFIKCPAYSKILHIHIKNNQYVITFKSESYVGYNSDNDWKKFNIKTLGGLMQNNQHLTDNFEYFTTIRVVEDDFIDYYHIFIEEVKSVAELRDNKIDEIMDQEF